MPKWPDKKGIPVPAHPPHILNNCCWTFKECLRNEKCLSHGASSALFNFISCITACAHIDKCCMLRLCAELRTYWCITCSHVLRMKIIVRFLCTEDIFLSPDFSPESGRYCCCIDTDDVVRSAVFSPAIQTLFLYKLLLRAHSYFAL